MSENASQMHLQAAGEVERACDNCGSMFTPARGWSRFCKPSCRNAFHQRAARRQAIKDAAPEMYEALRLLAATSCERLTSGPGSCWSEPGWTKDAKFGADRWCTACIALAAIHDLKEPEAPALLEKPKA